MERDWEVDQDSIVSFFMRSQEPKTQRRSEFQTFMFRESQINIFDCEEFLKQSRRKKLLKDQQNEEKLIQFQRNIVQNEFLKKPISRNDQSKSQLKLKEEKNQFQKIDGYSNIFQQKLIEKEGKKNTNLPKFFLRIYLKYEVFPSQRKCKRTNNYNLTDLLETLDHNDIASNKLRRLKMRKLLNERLRQQIILNNYVNNKRTYMITSKVFALRCSNKTLTERLQFR